MKMSLTPLEFHELMRDAPPEAPKPRMVTADDLYIAVMGASIGEGEEMQPMTLGTKQHYARIAMNLNKRLQSA